MSLDTPDGKRIPLPSTEEFLAANLAALQHRAKVTRDSPLASRLPLAR